MKRKNRRSKDMATQIAATPIVTGKSAKKISKQLKIKPTSNTDLGYKILNEFFKDKEE